MTNASAQPMFHTRIVPLEAALHGELKLNRDAGFGFSAGAATVPIGIDEFEAAAHSYPILFTDRTPPIPVVLLGFRPGWNLFVNDLGAWMQGAYVPAIVRAFPFAIIESENSETRLLGFESDAACITPSTGLPLFDSGNPTAVIRDAFAFCQSVSGRHEREYQLRRSARSRTHPFAAPICDDRGQGRCERKHRRVQNRRP
jgi:hypothetical protein